MGFNNRNLSHKTLKDRALSKFRHILSLNRIMYHHHLLTTEDNETIKKIYEKQKSEPTKGDWYELLKKDFEFIGKDINEDDIKAQSKVEYKQKMKALIQKAAFQYFLEQQNKHSKLNQINYSQFKIQPYLIEGMFNKEERKLMVSLRSKCHSAKLNFQKLYKGDLKCSFGCNSIEDQVHLFTQCKYIAVYSSNSFVYEDLFKDTLKQKEVIKTLMKIEKRRVLLKDNIHLGIAMPGPEHRSLI